MSGNVVLHMKMKVCMMTLSKTALIHLLKLWSSVSGMT